MIVEFYNLEHGQGLLWNDSDPGKASCHARTCARELFTGLPA